ncbi:MAG: glutamate synthase subunit beta [Bacteroidia bacterium]|nr:glutamate synthase subunit beta [Bacteroidia bacterium]
MSDPSGFMKYTRELPKPRDPEQRIEDYSEIYNEFDHDKVTQQATRCMNCGVPFCHSGCPLGNIIPEFNEAVHEGDWEQATEILLSTNNFPEFTGRICPAPCEASCVLGINQPPVTIENIEKHIAEVAFEKGYMQPVIPSSRTGKSVAIVGSGPAGLAAAAQLNKAGHQVTVFERNTRIGGLLRYGIPDFKLEKQIVDRRVALMEEEGIEFKTNVEVGIDIDARDLASQYDAVLLCGGSTIPRDLPIPGRELRGIHFAMDFLEQNNKRVAGDVVDPYKAILATDKDVVVIGGGDTGSDCVGTSNRHKARSITQIELLSKPPDSRAESTPWPLWPMQLRTSSSHKEGCDRQWSILTKEFVGDANGYLTGIKLVDIEWKKNEDTGKSEIIERQDSERVIPCDLALLAIGFVHPQFEGMLQQLEIEVTDRGNVRDSNYQTNVDNVFVAGDMRRGQSLVVWAIAEGREAARSVDVFLMGSSSLEARDQGTLEIVF